MKTYASGIRYAAHGAVRLMQLGNGLMETTQFNTRLQTTRVQLGTGTDAGEWLSILLDYGTTDNNGNVKTQTVSDAGWAVSQSYGYDALNRLQSASEPGTAPWQIGYGYGRYGNQWVQENETSGLILDPLTPRSEQSFTASNQLKLTGYDDAGNQTQVNPWTLSWMRKTA